MNDQPVAVAAIYTTRNKYRGRIFKLSAGFETAIPAIEPPKSYALDRNNLI
jgi:hypothetical protein